jgi:hypothetical protein
MFIIFSSHIHQRQQQLEDSTVSQVLDMEIKASAQTRNTAQEFAQFIEVA